MGEYSLGDAMRKFLNQSHMKGSIQALQIEEVWEQIMGKTVARYTDKIQIHGHTFMSIRRSPRSARNCFIKKTRSSSGSTKPSERM